jgi:HEAT repeat protein
MKRSAVVLGLLAALSLTGQTQQIEGLLAKIATYQYGGDPTPAIQLEELLGKLSGSVERKKSAEALLLKFLQSEATPAGKEAAFRGLSLIGGDASLPVLAPLLTQVDTADMARYAVAAIPGPAADEALRKALAAAPSDRVKVGIINSLGRRRDAKSVQALAALIPSGNAEVTAASAAALASISDAAAVGALGAARKKAGAQNGEVLSQAYAVSADHLAARGDKTRAIAVYKELAVASEPATVRTRAFKGLAAVDPKTAVPLLVAEMKTDDSERQVNAIRLLSRLPGAEVTKALVPEFGRLTPVGQVHLLTALASRGDASVRPVVSSALKSSEPAVRAAALSALGQVGDESSVKVLAEAAAAGKEPEQTAARRALYSLRGANIDSAVVAAIGSSTGKTKSELIVASGERAIGSAANALAEAARDSDAEIRRDALRALRNVGGAGQTQALLDLLLKSSTASERRDATLTLAAVVRRAQPTPIAPVLAAYRSAQDKEARLSLLEVMGQASSAEALPLLREGIKNPDPEIARAGILALTAWDDAAPLPDLMSLAKSREAAENLRVLALRGVLRLITLPSKRSVSESGLLLRDTMGLAEQTAEKRAVLSLLASFPSKESLEVAQAATTDQAVANEAKVAFAQVTEALKLK